MFEVIIDYNDGRRDTYDCTTHDQATFIFFRARTNDAVDNVVLTEMVEVDYFT